MGHTPPAAQRSGAAAPLAGGRLGAGPFHRFTTMRRLEVARPGCTACEQRPTSRG